MLGPEASSDQFAALAGDATAASIEAGRGSRQGSRGGAATTAGEQAAGSLVASEAALPREEAHTAKPKVASAGAASAGTDPDLPEVEEAENPDSVSGGVDQLDPNKGGGSGVDPADDVKDSALQAAATTSDYGDELTAGRTSE